MCFPSHSLNVMRLAFCIISLSLSAVPWWPAPQLRRSEGPLLQHRTQTHGRTRGHGRNTAEPAAAAQPIQRKPRWGLLQQLLPTQQLSSVHTFHVGDLHTHVSQLVCRSAYWQVSVACCRLPVFWHLCRARPYYDGAWWPCC
jgi:hypothetical protein